eukprot:TRINITY_DN6557_c0_g1_i2.p1 TRINITY_DN6557_c0_g1~~TRINITY_DN6557_c0_g1_i2.p1  ORF type:complete len:228 (-),score=43.01 TRINITY_DN6557_c0_g1_i2:118-801(-)
MVSFLEEQEAFACKFNSSAYFKSPCAVNDLIIAAFGHASAFVLSSSVGPALKPVATISCQYHNELSDIFIIYLHPNNFIVAAATEKFKAAFANDVLRLVLTHVQFSHAVVLEDVPTLKYHIREYPNNTLLWVGTSGCKSEMKRTQRVDPGAILGSLMGATLAACEVAQKECYAFLGIVQEYSASKSSLKTFEGISEVFEYVKPAESESHLRKVVNATNAKLENHLFL